MEVTLGPSNAPHRNNQKTTHLVAAPLPAFGRRGCHKGGLHTRKPTFPNAFRKAELRTAGFSTAFAALRKITFGLVNACKLIYACDLKFRSSALLQSCWVLLVEKDKCLHGALEYLHPSVPGVSRVIVLIVSKCGIAEETIKVKSRQPIRLLY